MFRLSLSGWKNQYTSVWKPETVIGVQKMKRHCLVSVHFHGNQTDLIKNKDSWGLVPVYHFPGWCMDPWNSSHKGLWVHNSDLVDCLFAVILISVISSAQNFAHVMTWFGNFLPTRYWLWPHQRLVNWAHGFMRNIMSYTVWSRYNMFDSLQNTCNRHSIFTCEGNIWGSVLKLKTSVLSKRVETTSMEYESVKYFLYQVISEEK